MLTLRTAAQERYVTTGDSILPDPVHNPFWVRSVLVVFFRQCHVAMAFLDVPVRDPLKFYLPTSRQWCAIQPMPSAPLRNRQHCAGFSLLGLTLGCDAVRPSQRKTTTHSKCVYSNQCSRDGAALTIIAETRRANTIMVTIVVTTST